MTDENESNPYAPPRSRITPPQPVAVARVEGNCIVVKSGSRLPMRCIVSNVPCSSSDQKKLKLRYAPSFRLVITHKTCLMHRCLSAKRRKRQYLIRISLIGTICAVVLAFTGFSIVAGITAGGISAACFSTASLDPLKIVKHKNGEFWITGFHDDFLDSLVSEDGWMRV